MEFYYRLAGHLKIGTLHEMLSRISSREISGWMAFERVHGPIGQRRDDILTAMVLAMIANTNRPKGKAAVGVEKFLPNWDAGRPQTDDEMWAAIRQANDAMGGTTGADTADRPRPRTRMRPKFHP